MAISETTIKAENPNLDKNYKLSDEKSLLCLIYRLPCRSQHIVDFICDYFAGGFQAIMEVMFDGGGINEINLRVLYLKVYLNCHQVIQPQLFSS